MRKIYMLVLLFSILGSNSIAQQISLTGRIINSDENPIKNVLVCLANNPKLYCYSDSLGNFSITNTSTPVTEVRQNEIISFENRKLSIYANNQPISVDVITADGRLIMNILNLNKSPGIIELYPEAYISDLPNTIYILRARVGYTFQSFKIQNIIPSGVSQGITQHNINDTIDNFFSEPGSETKSVTKSGVPDTLVLVHDFYKSRKIPLDSYIIHYDSIHLNNYSDYSMAEGFEPDVTYWYNGYANFTNIFSADSMQFIIDYDTLTILKGDLKIIAIPVDKIEGLDNSIMFISGLHFEPSGTKFLQPVQVSVLLKDSIPENLVVFHYTDQGETYYIPYVSHVLSSGGHCIIFNINHFSSIGIGIGDIHPPTDNFEGFTISDQFLSYLDEYMRYYKAIGTFGGIPEELFTTWFNNVIAPMISKINTWEDFGAAIDEFLHMAKTWARFGNGSSFTELPFYGTAREMFCNKMMKIWNELIVEYNGLNDTCLKREILDIALSILEQNALLGGFCTELSHPNLSDMNVFGNGEFFNLANKIEFTKPVKHLDIGATYIVEYTLKSFSGNTIPEIVTWSSSNPLVATINADGKVTGISDGEAIITGNICDIENTLKVYVGKVDCENHYCLNNSGSCYSWPHRYMCKGVTSYIETEYDFCGTRTYKQIDRFTLRGELNDPTPYENIYSSSYENKWNGRKCDNSYYAGTETPDGYFYCSAPALFYYKFASIHFYVQGSGYLKEDKIILNVRYNAGDEGYKTTTFGCTCFDK